MSNFGLELTKEQIAQRQEQEERDRLEKEAKRAKEEAERPWNQLSKEDQQALLDPHQFVPTTADKDMMMRRDMRVRAEQGDETAQAWVEADKKAQSAETSMENINREIKRREDPSYLQQAHDKLEEVRHRLDEHRENRPHLFARKEWSEQLEGLKKEETHAQHHWQERVEKSSGEELGKLQKRLEDRSQEQQEAEAKRQGIALLPSEMKSLEQQKQECKQTSMPQDYKKDIIPIQRDEEAQKHKHIQTA